MFTRFHKTLLIGAICAFFIQIATAQTIDWGDDIETNKDIGNIIGDTEDGHYALAYKSSHWYVEKYEGKGMTLASSTKLELPDMNGKKTEMGNVYYMEDQLVMFTWHTTKKHANTTCMATC
ncbi:MAG: hypothetical protein R3B47_19980 [Bacteroidia bacterium]